MEAKSTPPPNKGRIMDRKIEASGWSTFSSNLVQNRLTPHTSADSLRPRGRDLSGSSSGGSSSVRAIVDWLESTRSSSINSSGTISSHEQQPSQAKTTWHHNHDAGEGDGHEVESPCRPLPRLPPPKPFQVPSSQSRRRLPGPSSTSIRSSSATAQQLPVPAPVTSTRLSIGGGDSTEDYSLTLLKYKSYFNNRPLGRCLDPASSSDNATTTITRPGLVEQRKKAMMMETELQEVDRKRPARPVVPKEEEETPATTTMAAEKNAAQPPVRHTKSSSAQKLEEVMEELAAFSSSLATTGEMGLAPTASISTSSPPPPLPPIQDNPPSRTPPPRPPEEVKKYWDGVRNYLFISDSELYGEDDTEEEEGEEDEGVSSGTSRYSSDMDVNGGSAGSPVPESFPPLDSTRTTYQATNGDAVTAEQPSGGQQLSLAQTLRNRLRAIQSRQPREAGTDKHDEGGGEVDEKEAIATALRRARSTSNTGPPHSTDVTEPRNLPSPPLRHALHHHHRQQQQWPQYQGQQQQQHSYPSYSKTQGHCGRSTQGTASLDTGHSPEYDSPFTYDGGQSPPDYHQSPASSSPYYGHDGIVRPPNYHHSPSSPYGPSGGGGSLFPPSYQSFSPSSITYGNNNNNHNNHYSNTGHGAQSPPPGYYHPPYPSSTSSSSLYGHNNHHRHRGSSKSSAGGKLWRSHKASLGSASTTTTTGGGGGSGGGGGGGSLLSRQRTTEERMSEIDEFLLPADAGPEWRAADGSQGR